MRTGFHYIKQTTPKRFELLTFVAKMIAQPTTNQSTRMFSKAGYVLSLFLLVLGAVMLIVGIDTHHWVILETDRADFEMGLWKMCADGRCIVYDDTNSLRITDDLKVVRGLIITAAVLYVLALLYVLIIAMTGCNVNDKVKVLTGPLICGLGAVFAIAGVGHFAKIIEDDSPSDSKYHYGYSFHMSWASAVFILIGGVVMMAVLNRFYKYKQRQARDQHQVTFSQRADYPPVPPNANMGYPPHPIPMYSMTPPPYSSGHTYDNPAIHPGTNPSGYYAPEPLYDQLEKRLPSDVGSVRSS